MNFVDFLTPAIQLANQASAYDNAKNYEKAKEYYEKAIEHFITAVKHETLPQKKALMRDKTNELLERAMQIKKFLQEQSGDSASSEPSKDGAATKEKPKTDKKTKQSKEDDELASSLDSTILATKPNVTWKDVAGLVEAKEALKEAVIFPIVYPQFFHSIAPWKGILLYGPPGTGKSYLAQAIANEANCTFFNVSASNLVSKWQGETEKLISQLFKKAREMKPSIVFIDEIDSLCSARGDNDNDATRRGKTELLIQMDGVGKDEKGLLVLGATNIPWNLDEAFIRRFERRVHIGLPDYPARAAMLEIHIGKADTSLTKENIAELAKRTEHYSGSDIKNLVKNALMEPLRKCKQATHFKMVTGKEPMNPTSGQIMNDLYTPCSPGDPNAQELTLTQINPQKLLPPPVGNSDFLKALATSSPSVDPNSLEKYKNFTDKVNFSFSFLSHFFSKILTKQIKKNRLELMEVKKPNLDWGKFSYPAVFKIYSSFDSIFIEKKNRKKKQKTLIVAS